MTNANYVLGHSESEIERLKRQAEMMKPITQRLLLSAGLKEGMRVLDIGCGPGDVTMLAADIVGPTGRVVGIDRSESVIDAARGRIRRHGLSNVEFAQHDVETYDGPVGFDAVVCRFVLIHQPDPVRFLRAARRLVRSGGVVAFHEIDATRRFRSSPPVPLLHQMDALLVAAFDTQGTAGDAGGRFVELFADAGLPTPRLFTEVFIESGEDAIVLSWFTDVFRQFLPHLIAAGVVTEDEIDIDTLTDRLQRAAMESRSQLESVPQICAWTTV